MIPELGQWALCLALGVSLLLSVLPLWGAHKNLPQHMALARPLARILFVLVGAGFLALTASFVRNDFSVLYVATNANSALPLAYRIAGVWGGHEGSLLLWVMMLCVWMLAVAQFSRHLPAPVIARTLAVMGMIAAGFLLFMLATSNPFDRLLPVPADGQDLNPLLQDPGMVAHPPMLYMGYVGFSVAFAFSIAALLGGQLDAQWARWTRPWTTAAWVCLTIGIMLGSAWAYYELGWGGWWFWDPVENASLMPWLAATALLHSVSVLASRNALRTWTIMLGVVAFSMSMVGTFLVRSGILTSVHAFAVDPTRGAFILALLAIYIGGALNLFALRASTISEGEQFNVTSREGALVMNNVLLSATLGVILIGTLYPLVAESLGAKVSVGPPYFNPMSAVFIIPMLLVMAIGPLLRWRRDSFARIGKMLLLPAVVTAGALAMAVGAGLKLLPLLGLALGLGLLIASLLPLRGRKLRTVKLPLWGMVVAHLGVAVSLLGMASEAAFTQERLVAARLGEAVQVGPWTVKVDRVSPVAGPNWTAIEANMQARYEDGAPVELHPQARSFWSPPQETNESALVTRWNGQLYAVLGEQAEDGRWQLRLWWKPFVTLIWLGGLMIALGGLLALLGRVASDLRRIVAKDKIAYRRMRQGR